MKYLTWNIIQILYSRSEEVLFSCSVTDGYIDFTINDSLKYCQLDIL